MKRLKWGLILSITIFYILSPLVANSQEADREEDQEEEEVQQLVKLTQ